MFFIVCLLKGLRCVFNVGTVVLERNIFISHCCTLYPTQDAMGRLTQTEALQPEKE